MASVIDRLRSSAREMRQRIQKSSASIKPITVDIHPKNIQEPAAVSTTPDVSALTTPEPSPLSNDTEISFKAFPDIKTVGQLKEHFFMPKEQDITMADIERTTSVLGDVANKFNMRPSDIVNFSEHALVNDAPLMFRPINPDVPRLLEEGAVGKGFATKEKSAPAKAGPLAGMIPVNASFSKLGFVDELNGQSTSQDRDMALEKIGQFEAKAQKHLRDDGKFSDDAKAFATAVSGIENAEITKRIFDDGTTIYSCAEHSFEVPPIMPAGNRDELQQETTISADVLAGEFKDTLKHRVHAPTDVKDKDGNKLHSFTQKDGSPTTDAKGNLIVCTKDEQGKYFQTDENGVKTEFTPSDAITEVPLQVMSYRDFEIGHENGQISFSENTPLPITADYDQLTFATKEISNDAEGVTKAQTARSGFGSNQDYAVTVGLQEDNSATVAHNQEHGNTKYAENFSQNEIHPTFKGGPAQTGANEYEVMQKKQQANLVAKLLMDDSITTENYRDEGSPANDYVGFPVGEEGVAQEYQNMQSQGYDVNVNEAWRQNKNFNNELWDKVANPNGAEQEAPIVETPTVSNVENNPIEPTPPPKEKETSSPQLDANIKGPTVDQTEKQTATPQLDNQSPPTPSVENKLSPDALNALKNIGASINAQTQDKGTSSATNLAPAQGAGQGAAMGA